MNRLKDFVQSITGQLIMTAVLLQGVMMGIFLFSFIKQEQINKYNNELLSERSLSELIASNVSVALLNNDLVALQELISQADTLPDIEKIFICDKHYRILAANDSKYFNQTVNDGPSLALHEKWEKEKTKSVQIQHDGVLDTCSAVMIGTKPIGYVRIISSTQRLEAQMDDLARWGVLYTMITTLMGGIFAWLFVRKLTVRISILSDAAFQITQKNYDLTLEPFSENDELSKMGRAFNVMIDSIHDQVKSLSIEIEQRKKTEELLEYQAHHDELTHLCNRLLFMDRLTHAIHKAKREEGQLAVLFIDLDRFKEINDSLGHEIGDHVLINVANRLKENLREVDTIARLGGDEFALILEGISELHIIDEIAEKMVEILREPITIDQHLLYITSSIGISLYPIDGESAQSLLRNADSAMYKAKEEGRNSYQYYTEELTQRAIEWVALESNLRRAIEKQEFVVYYQPQMNGESEKMIGMEALVRWMDPERGIVSPAEFIPLAEDTGMILAIDAFVMRSAIQQMVAWRKEGFDPGILSLNLAMKQLWKDSFVDSFQALLNELECKAEWVELEVTEGEIMKNPEKAIAILQRLHEMGVLLAIDDFGTGYSSLSYLKRLPLDILKIDQSFIRGIPDHNEDVAIVRSTITLAKSMGMSVIAEGVETLEQKEFLVENGCSNIQGYFYSRPISRSEMDHRLRQTLVN